MQAECVMSVHMLLALLLCGHRALYAAACAAAWGWCCGAMQGGALSTTALRCSLATQLMLSQASHACDHTCEWSAADWPALVVWIAAAAYVKLPR